MAFDGAGYFTRQNEPSVFMNAFRSSVGAPQVADTAAALKNQTAMQLATGQSFVKDLPAVNTSTYKLNTNQAMTNRAEMGKNAFAAREQVSQVSQRFSSEVKKVQNTLLESMSQACAQTGIDFKAAQSSFIPRSSSSDADVAMTLAPDIALPGAASIMKVADVISEVKYESGKLTSAQEARLADQMYTLLTPTRDVSGNITAPPAVASQYDFEKIPKAQFTLKALFQPPEMHPEGKMIADMAHDYDENVLPIYSDAGEQNYEKTGKVEELIQETDKDDNWRIQLAAYNVSETLPFVRNAQVDARSAQMSSVQNLMKAFQPDFKPQPALQAQMGVRI